MFTTSQRALALFTDLTDNAALPLAPAELQRDPRFQQHDHVFFGDLVLRRYKHKNRWGFDDRDVRSVGQKLADMAVAFDDASIAPLGFFMCWHQYGRRIPGERLTAHKVIARGEFEERL